MDYKPYLKINTLYKRNEKGIIIPDEFSDNIFRYLYNIDWYILEKLNGSNIQIIWDPFSDISIRYRGRSESSNIPCILLDVLQNKFEPIKYKLKKLFPDKKVRFFGEGIGPGITLKHSYNNSYDIVLFDVVVNDSWLLYPSLKDISNELDINYVPCVNCGNLDVAINIVKNGFKSYIDPTLDAEGVVAVTMCKLLNENGDPIKVKLKTVDFKHMNV